MFWKKSISDPSGRNQMQRWHMRTITGHPPLIMPGMGRFPHLAVRMSLCHACRVLRFVAELPLFA
jgi:hypothetical protein